MIIKTRFFGDVELDESKVITFEDGIPGFFDLKKFLLMTDEDEKSPFCWLQSIEEMNIVFTLFDVYSIIPNYNPVVSEEMLKDIGEFKDEDILIYTIANIPEDLKEISINLKAPIIINMHNNKAKQIILENQDYQIRTYIYDKLKNKGD